MSVQLSAAITAPVQVDPNNMLAFQVRPMNKLLHDALTKLNSSISYNAEAIFSLQQAVQDLKSTVRAQDDRIIQFSQQAQEVRLELSSAIQQLRNEVSVVKATSVTKATFEKEIDRLSDDVSYTRGFIDEIEKGQGERVSKFVMQYITDYVPNWFASVSKELWGKIDKSLAKVGEETNAKIDKRAKELESAANGRILESESKSFAEAASLNEERRREIGKLRTETNAEADRLDSAMDKMNLALSETIAKESEVIHSKLENVESAATGLFRTLCLDADVCRELEGMANGGAEDLLLSDASTLSHDALLRDPRVQYVAQTPHFLALRAAVQKEFNEKVEFFKADLHQELVGEVIDLQREIKGKVGANKLAELLVQYRDQQLYGTVKSLATDMAEVRVSKIDSAQFIEALKSKADRKGLDAKADVQYVSSNVTAALERVDTVETTISKINEKLRKLEVDNLRMLHFLATGRPPPDFEMQHTSGADSQFTEGKKLLDLFHKTKRKGAAENEVLDGVSSNPLHPVVPSSITVDDKRSIPVELAAVFGPGEHSKEPSKPSSSRGRHYRGNAHSGHLRKGISLAARTSMEGDGSVSPHKKDGPPGPLTSSQRAYCEAVGIDEVQGSSIMQGHTSDTHEGSTPQARSAQKKKTTTLVSQLVLQAEEDNNIPVVGFARGDD